MADEIAADVVKDETQAIIVEGGGEGVGEEGGKGGDERAGEGGGEGGGKEGGEGGGEGGGELVAEGGDEGGDEKTDEKILKMNVKGEGEEEIDEEEDFEEGDEESGESGEEEVEQEEIAAKDKAFVEEAWGEMPGEGEEGEEEEGEAPKVVEEEEEEEGIEEELPPDPDAPYNLTDESEAQKAPFSLNEEQLGEVQELWASYQDYTPAYTVLDQYITPVELAYMLKALNLHTHTPEQMFELIDFCVRPPHPDNHITFEAFLWMVTIRQRDMPIEEEIRLALEVMDPGNTGIIDREYLREVLRDHGKGMKTVDMFIKEVDMSNDGVLGLEDIVGTICIDLNRDDIEMLLKQIYPPEEEEENKIEELTS